MTEFRLTQIALIQQANFNPTSRNKLKVKTPRYSCNLNPNAAALTKNSAYPAT
jgi:hypothetical protein